MSQSGDYVEVNENENLNDNDSQEQIVIVEDDGDDDVVARQSSEDGNDPERAAIRERRRKEKAERKDRRDKAITRDKLELDFLRKRNDDLEKRLSTQEMRAYHSDLQNIDAHYAQAQREVQMAEHVIAKASTVGNGDDVVQAIRYRDEAIAKAQQLAQYKQQAAYYAPPQAPSVDDMTLHHAKEFLEEHPWYDMQGRDEASAVVLAIDQSLAKEGLNPQSEDYWDELRDRVAKRLPDKVGKGARRPRGGPAVGSGREYAPTSTRKEVYISAERKQALIEAGVWDDPVLRMKYVKRYAQYDRDRGE
jgi:hypothetical protein